MEDSLIEWDYEINTGIQLVNHFSKNNLDPSEGQMCLAGSYGPFTWVIDEYESLYDSVV